MKHEETFGAMNMFTVLTVVMVPRQVYISVKTYQIKLYSLTMYGLLCVSYTFMKKLQLLKPELKGKKITCLQLTWQTKADFTIKK